MKEYCLSILYFACFPKWSDMIIEKPWRSVFISHHRSINHLTDKADTTGNAYLVSNKHDNSQVITKNLEAWLRGFQWIILAGRG